MDVEMKIQEPINKVTRKQKLKNYSKHPGSFLLALLTKLAILLTVLALGFILIYILVKGIPNLSTDLFALKYTTENVSMLPAIINTLMIILTFLMYSRTDWNFFSDIFSRVCKKRKQTSGSGSRYGGNTDRNSIHSLRTVRNVVFCYNVKMRLFPSGRSADLIHYGASGHYANNGRGIVSSS